jgi:hypothetical protein
MSVTADYTLKQSKVSCSVDSNLHIKSLVESQLSPGTTMQLSAEILHAKEHYRFGYGVTLGTN